MHQAGADEGVDLGGRQPQDTAGVPGELRHRAGVSQCVGRLEVDEVRDGTQGGVDVVPVESPEQRRFPGDDRVPGRDRVDLAEQPIGVVHQGAHQCRIELAAGALAGQGNGRIDAADAMRHLDVLGELADARGERDLLAGQVAGPAFPVPALVGRRDGLLRRVVETELLGQSASGRGMALDHVVDLAVAAEGELQADAEAVQRRIARPDEPHAGHDAAQAARLVAVLGGLERDVVAEPLGLLMSIRVTADVHQQRRVVQRRPLFVVEAQAVGEPEGDDALTQDVFHRLSEAEVDAQRQGGDQLREAQLAARGVRRAVRCHRRPPARARVCAPEATPVGGGHAPCSACRWRSMASLVAFSCSVGLNMIICVPSSKVGTWPGGM